MSYFFRGIIGLAALLLVACGGSQDQQASGTSVPDGEKPSEPAAGISQNSIAASRIGIYAPFALTADMSSLSDNQRSMIRLLVKASDIMDELFWHQTYGDKTELLNSIEDETERRFAVINYGPWDRLDGDAPFVSGVGDKPPGANLYPKDMTREEFETADIDDKTGLYSLIRRNDDGQLVSVPYHVAYADQLSRVGALMREAADLAENNEFANYLRLRAVAIETDEYQTSDMAWMDMKSNPIELVIGAIETYEDLLFGYRAGYEAYVLIKDQEWSKRLSRLVAFLPELQAGLPVIDEYKKEEPGTDSDLNAYDVVYYAGHSNSGSKTIAINLPNDEQVQLAKGTRRLQLKNAMRAKFDKILVEIANELIVPEQQKYITFNAFFSGVMFHEIAHGLGIKNTIDGSGTVREALLEYASAIEEGKADILGLYMITSLHDKGELTDGELMDYYVTFMAGIFRSVRFGASSAHGRANMIRFNFFKDMNAFDRDSESGRYSVNHERFRVAVAALTKKLLTLQGDGDYEGVSRLMEDMGVIRPDLQADLDRLSEKGIPVDIVFEQGADVLGL